MRFRNALSGHMLVIACAIVLLAGCRDEAAQKARMAAYQKDSILYEQDLAAFLRDSLVIDSIANTVPTDSIYLLYRSLLRGADPREVFQEIGCLNARYTDRFGSEATLRALGRMHDSLWRGVSEDTVRALNTRMPPMTEVRIGEEECKLTGIPRAESLGSTPLRFSRLRPRPPKRPSFFPW